MYFKKLAIVSDDHAPATDARCKLESAYATVPAAEADLIVALGGDGFMLNTVHQHMDRAVPIYGMNLGSVGFLMNEFRIDGLLERLRRSEAIVLHPLQMMAETTDGTVATALAINEVSLLRALRYAAKIRILVDGIVRIDELICDGVLLSTPAGSTAYNFSVYGPILPLGTGLLALTPISAFRPRRWRGALLPHGSKVVFEIIDPEIRPVAAVADFTEVRDVVRVSIQETLAVKTTLLFDPEHNLEERILREQFQP
jgi:NAD+ kinase